MPGAQIQLAAASMGGNNIYLTGNELTNMSYFTSVYKRHHNFASEPIRWEFDGAADFGRTVRVTVPKKGDLLNRLFFRLKLPSLTITSGTFAGWTNSIGLAVIEQIEMRVNGEPFPTVYPEYLDMYSELSEPENANAGYNLMVGTFDIPEALEVNADSTTVYTVPLNYWFSKLEQSLPLISLSRSNIELTFKFRPFIECLHFDGTTPPTAVSMIDAAVYGHHVFLDDNPDGTPGPEKMRFTKQYETEMKKVSDPRTGVTTKQEVYKMEWDERSQQNLPIPASLVYLAEEVQFFGTFSLNAGQTQLRADISDFNLPCTELIYAFRETASEDNNDWFNYSRRSDNTAFLAESWIEFDGRNRAERQPEEYNRLVVPYMNHTRPTNRHIYVHSFSEFPERSQPSGTMDFSRADNVTLHCTMKANNPPCKLFVFARNYNLIVISGGQIGRAWLD